MLHLLAEISPFEWASTHLQLIGWPALVYFAWKVGTHFQKFTFTATKTVAQIDQMAMNHFPHMEISLAKQDIHLENIDRNIERMANKL